MKRIVSAAVAALWVCAMSYMLGFDFDQRGDIAYLTMLFASGAAAIAFIATKDGP